MENASVRKAEVADVCQIAPLYAEYLNSFEHSTETKQIEEFLKFLVEKNWVQLYFARTLDGKCVGLVGCTLSYSSISTAGAIAINDLYVAPSHRRSGIAKSLCNAVEQFAIGEGLKKIYVQTSLAENDAVNMYKSMKFESLPHILMERELGDE